MGGHGDAFYRGNSCSSRIRDAAHVGVAETVGTGETVYSCGYSVTPNACASNGNYNERAEK